MAKRASPKLVKIHRNYTYQEAAKLLRVNKRTVAEWCKNGSLPVIKDQKPHLILGADLKLYLENRRKPKENCLPHQCYCFTCHTPRDPAFDALEYHARNAKQGHLIALCAVCSTVMNKGTKPAILNDIGAQYKVRIIKADQRLSD